MSCTLASMRSKGVSTELTTRHALHCSSWICMYHLYTIVDMHAVQMPQLVNTCPFPQQHMSPKNTHDTSNTAGGNINTAQRNTAARTQPSVLIQHSTEKHNINDNASNCKNLPAPPLTSAITCPHRSCSSSHLHACCAPLLIHFRFAATLSLTAGRN
jgi:hypothetical protein